MYKELYELFSYYFKCVNYKIIKYLEILSNFKMFLMGFLLFVVGLVGFWEVFA